MNRAFAFEHEINRAGTAVVLPVADLPRFVRRSSVPARPHTRVGAVPVTYAPSHVARALISICVADQLEGFT